MKELLELYNEELPIVYSTQFCEIPPWKLNLPTIHKEFPNSRNLKQTWYLSTGIPSTDQQHPMSLNIYTDGSKTANGTGRDFIQMDNHNSGKNHAAASFIQLNSMPFKPFATQNLCHNIPQPSVHLSVPLKQ
ncbi:hypothetical protein JTB14_000092 [Gonioctena quinquepunctata]|nr:hypothetical protein JTB14_000092 [Gonioctena quinquepunctata]